jgi:hypothetical protein
LCIALTRFWIRWSVFGFDDAVVLAATLVTLGHTGTSYAALLLGLGKPWSEISNSGKLPELNNVGLKYAASKSITTTDNTAGVDRRCHHIHHRTVHIKDWSSYFPQPDYKEQDPTAHLLRLLSAGGNLRHHIDLGGHCRLFVAVKLLLGLLCQQSRLRLTCELKTT